MNLLLEKLNISIAMEDKVRNAESFDWFLFSIKAFVSANIKSRT